MPFWSIEPILQAWRFSKIKPYFPAGGVLVDIGCNDPPYTINRVREKMDFCVGIDAEIQNTVSKNYELKQCFIEKKVPVESELANVITMLAVLEHLDHPQAIINECYRILKPGGILLITVPSPLNKYPLEILSKLGIVQQKMIDQHKNYFTHQRLRDMFEKAGFNSASVESFQLGLNTFARAIK
jgi:ubiquinone/menaquinone biosynthesis C-methylase UbiE